MRREQSGVYSCMLLPTHSVERSMGFDVGSRVEVKVDDECFKGTIRSFLYLRIGLVFDIKLDNGKSLLSTGEQVSDISLLDKLSEVT